MDQDWIQHCSTYLPRERHTIQVDSIAYMDMIASRIGCLPDLKALWIQDWNLAFLVTFGPAVPSHYRLSGRGQWTGAKETILS
jgi:hypothetical protein